MQAEWITTCTRGRDANLPLGVKEYKKVRCRPVSAFQASGEAKSASTALDTPLTARRLLSVVVLHRSPRRSRVRRRAPKSVMFPKASRPPMDPVMSQRPSTNTSMSYSPRAKRRIEAV